MERKHATPHGSDDAYFSPLLPLGFTAIVQALFAEPHAFNFMTGRPLLVLALTSHLNPA